MGTPYSKMTEEQKKNRRYAIKRWRKANREKVRDANKVWYCANAKKQYEQQKKWRAENAERKRDTDRKRYARNPAKQREKSLKWRRANPEKAKESYQKCRQLITRSKRFFESSLLANEIGKLNETKGTE